MRVVLGMKLSWAGIVVVAYDYRDGKARYMHPAWMTPWPLPGSFTETRPDLKQ
jgi:hypothetical protein